MDVLAPHHPRPSPTLAPHHTSPPPTASSKVASTGAGTSYGCTASNISRAASMAALSPPKRSERKKSVGDLRSPSRSGATPVPYLSRSTSCLSPKQKNKSSTPITEQVLKVASKMDDPKAKDLSYLVEDAKLLHQKLTALETEGIDLAKVGLFSKETLASFTPPPTPTVKRPRGVAYENVPNSKTDLPRRASMASVSSTRKTSISSRKASSMPRGSLSSVSSSASESTKSKKRNFFPSFGRAKGKRSSEELSRSLNEPRHSVPSSPVHQAEIKTPQKAGSVSYLPGTGMSLSQDSGMNRSSSLDVIDFDSVPSAGSVPASSLSQSRLSTSHRSTMSGHRLTSRGEGKTTPNNGNLSNSSHLPHGSSTLTFRHSSHSFKSSRPRQKSVDGILDSSDPIQPSARGSLAVSDYGTYPTASSATPPLQQRQLDSKPITRHGSADRILRDTDVNSRQRFSGGGSGSSPLSSQSTVGSQENLLNDSLSNPSMSSSPSSPLSQGPSSRTSRAGHEGDLEQKHTTRPATCSPGLEKSGFHVSSSAIINQKSRLRKTSAGNLPGTAPPHHDAIKANELASRGLGGSSSLPPTPQHASRPPKPGTLSKDSSSLSSQLNPPSSKHDSISTGNNLTKAPSQSGMNSRVTVATLVDELTEVEKQVRGSVDEDFSERSQKDADDGPSKRSQITASSATLELDQLMQNLEEFEPPAPPPEEQDRGNKKPKSAMDDLSNMLGSLEMDMENIHGVSTVAKGMCAACKKPILGKVLDALNRQWHPEHFVCAVCDTELGSITYYESNGKPYCEKDFHELFAPRCAYCNGPILERMMRALNKTWHPEHFFCTLCGKSFGSEGFHEKDEKAFCRECYYEKYAPRCRRCQKAIMEGFITALNAQWHPECFSCKVCGITFPRGNYFEHEGEPHCELHYHASRGTLCASCQKPVTGKCVTAMGRKWHPEHFTCAFCLKLLNKGTFKEHRHNPYCQTCYIKLFG